MLALDTNTVSYFFRGDPQVVPRMLATEPSLLAVPSVVVYELRYGLHRLPHTAAGPRIQALETFLRPLRILDFDATCADVAATIRARLERMGTGIGPHDLLIAATALRHQATLITRNTSEFSRVPGLDLVDWHATPAP